MKAKVGDVDVDFLIDSGSPVNTIPWETYEKLNREKAKLFEVKAKCSRTFYGYSSEVPLEIARTFRAKVLINDQKPSVIAEFFVVMGAKKALLGKPTAEALKVLKVGLNVNAVSKIEEFPKTPGIQVAFEIDHSVEPKKSAYFRVPLSVEEMVERKLDEMLWQGIIEIVSQPTKWISPLIVVPKGNNDIRICVNMKNPNKAIKRIHHPLPIMEDFLPNLGRAKLFSRLDIKSAYHHLELSEESRELTTFFTKRGLMRYKRLAFGVNCAPEIFQKFMEEVLIGIPGCMVMIDDIIIYGKDLEEHDRRLKMVLERLAQYRLTINKEKSVYRVYELDFLGFHLSRSGCAPTQEKVKALRNFRKPNSSDEVSSFLGLVTYVGSFIHNLSEKTKALRMVTKEPFKWTDEQQHEFDYLREVLMKETIERAYFRREADTFLYTDASGAGLGAVLLQKHNENGRMVPRVIAFASKALTDVEKRYAQTHREALAIVWAVKHFYMYLFGTKFTIMSDHLPLKYIFGPREKLMSKRMITRAEAWALQLQPFQFSIEFVPGKKNIADIFSRLMNTVDEPFEENSPCFLAAVTSWNNEGDIVSVKDVREATEKNDELQNVIKALQTGNWSSDLIKYRAFETELNVESGILTRNQRMVIPENLRERILHCAHQGHPGAVTTKNLLRERVWWLGMDRHVEDYLKRCLGCATVQRDNPPEALIRTRLPESPWDAVAIDFLEIREHGVKLLVLVDYYTRFVSVEIMKVTDASHLIEVLEKIFDIWGYPWLIRSDNGSPFQSQEFETWRRARDIDHDLTTPYTPQQNGEVERQNRGIIRALKIAKVLGQPWKRALKEYLNAYNRRPHRVTMKAPLSLMVNRKIRDELPQRLCLEPVDDEEWKDRDRIEKYKGKLYTDARRHAKPCDIKIGDEVLVKNQATGKLQSNFLPTPHLVIDRQANELLTQQEDGPVSRRSITQVKRWENPSENEKETVHPESDVEKRTEDMDVNLKDAQEEVVQEPDIDDEPLDQLVLRKSTRMRKTNPSYIFNTSEMLLSINEIVDDLMDKFQHSVK